MPLGKSNSRHERRQRGSRSLSSYKNWWNSKQEADRPSSSRHDAPINEESEDPYDERSATLGRTPKIRELYREDGEHPWDEWMPDIPREFGGSESEQYAIVICREKKHGKPGLMLHSITVQSPLLRDILDPIFENYEGLSTDLSELKFYEPFHEFYYRWHLFEQAYQDRHTEETRRHLELLYPIISHEILPHIQKLRDLTRNGLITFDHLWAIFPPDTDLYTRVDNQDCLFNLKTPYYAADMIGKLNFWLPCRYIDCNGKEFGYVESTISINNFQGVKKITDLEIFPCHLHPEPDKLLENLHSRGEKFEKLNGFNHVSYAGFYVDRSERSTRRKRYLEDGRIVVDPEMFCIQNGDAYNRLNPLDNPESDEAQNNGSVEKGLESVIQRATWKAFAEFEKLLDQYKPTNFSDSSSSLNTRQRLLCAPSLKGFCLTSKKWAEFYVDNIKPIQWSEDAFNRLVLPNGYKEIIHAFVVEQLSQDNTFDDIIRSKGQGFIMLLSGEPGVGKTLTAESVAEVMQKPIYYVTAGELGEDASQVEETLEKVLELTSKWQAILLLDECDIFLEQRTTADVARNRLVSIFLKQLEYYRGVLFLTTNRVAAFDPAFESRIHLSINYPALDQESRLHIWRTFVRPETDPSQYSSSVTDIELQELATHELNGRQIKNVVKTARLLAKNDKSQLTLKHIERVLNVKMANSLLIQPV